MSTANTQVPTVVTAALELPVQTAHHEACPVTDILRRIGDKWSVLVLVLLGRRTFLVPLSAVADWAVEHQGDIQAARMRHQNPPHETRGS